MTMRNVISLLIFWVIILIGATRAHAETQIIVHKKTHTLELIKDGQLVKEYDIITGKKHSPTPSFETEFNSIDINPTWNPTQSSVREFINDPELAKFNGIVNDNGHLYSPPGPHNPLGKARLNLQYRVKAVRIHGTSQPELFKTERRNYSHGCIRVLEIKDLVEHIIVEPINWQKHYTVTLPETIHVTVTD